jgi:hypothetical protein
MTPIIATAVLGLAGMGAVAVFDLFTFVIAFVTLAFCIKIPENERDEGRRRDCLPRRERGSLT